MNPAGDPTLSLLHKLRDPSQWVIIRGVPIFKPHKRKDQNGNDIYVDAGRLQTIMQNYERLLKQAGVVPRITPGHTLRDPKTPEYQQPDIYGWAVNWRMGTFGPSRETAILADYYLDPKHADEAKKYPYRSAEFYPPSNEITGVALLKRDPMLDMGLLTYERSTGCLFYAMGDEPMPDPTTNPPGGDPQAGMDPQLAEDPDFQKFCKYMQAYMAMNPGGMGGNPAAPSPTNGAPPSLPDKGAPDQFARNAEAVRYARIEKELEELRAARQTDRVSYAKTLAEKEVTALLHAGKWIPDTDGTPGSGAVKERDRMQKLFLEGGETAMQERVREIVTCYQNDPTADVTRLPGGQHYAAANGMVSVAAGKDDGEFTERDLDNAAHYMRTHPGCVYEDAEKYALEKRGKR